MKTAVEIMTEDVITVTPETGVKEVAKILSENKISGVPVVDEQELVGIVSDSDLIRQGKKLELPNYIYLLDSILYLESFKKFEEEFKKMVGAKVKDVMEREVHTVTSDATVEDIATMLADNEIKRAPVVDQEGNLIGIVSRGDIIDYLSE
ncbi:CBS domain-containing protein [Natroniella sulfidigena]|uniref:CBS domain-containing protein n=1 Tax=Natroniella sulfidigena TaxID=723921 RepID=UPI00200A6990|nr:CBS domain-containing protein [Natroniella sulfidigena]MCK8816861.1 CBS domain-containing protein [Natroniella sulfidigena]